MKSPFAGADLSAFTWQAFSREAMFDRKWYLRPERLVIYTATMLIGMAAQCAATYCMFKYKNLRSHISSFSQHTAHVEEIDIRTCSILSMVFPCLVVLFLNVEYTLLLFWPGRIWPKWYNRWFRTWYMVFATVGMLATIVASTVVVATRSASIQGVDQNTTQQLLDLYFRPPLEYRTWPQNIAWIVLMWITMVLNLASTSLMLVARHHDQKHVSSSQTSSINNENTNVTIKGPLSIETAEAEKGSLGSS